MKRSSSVHYARVPKFIIQSWAYQEAEISEDEHETWYFFEGFATTGDKRSAEYPGNGNRVFESRTVAWSGFHKSSQTQGVAAVQMQHLLLVTTARVVGRMSGAKRTARKIAIATYSQRMEVWAVTFNYYDSSQQPTGPFIACLNVYNISSGWTSRQEQRRNGRAKWFHFQILPLHRSAREWSWCPLGACAARSSSLRACS